MANRNLCILAASLAAAFSLSGKDFPAYERAMLEVPGMLGSVHLADVDGDAEMDLLMVLEDSSSNRRLAVRLKAGTLPNSETWEGPFPEEAVAFAFADAAGGPGAEWVVYLRDSLIVYEWGQAGYGACWRFKTSFPCLFPYAGPGSLLYPDLSFDFDGDSRNEICFPSMDRLEVYRFEDGRFALWRTYSSYPLMLQPETGACVLRPGFFLEPFDRDSIPDLWVTYGERLCVYIQQDSSDGAPDGPIIPDRIWSMPFRELAQSGLDPLAPQQTRLYPMDVNNDGQADLILSRASRAAFTRNVSQVQIYLNRCGWLEELPDAVLVSGNFAGEHAWADLDSNGLPELVMLSFSAGVAQAVHYLLTGKTYHSLLIHFQTEDSLFMQPPVRFPLLRRIRPEELLVPAWLDLSGDFNGDGIPDLLFRTDDSTIRIHAGKNTGFQKAGAVLRDIPGREHLIADLNRDGFADLLVWIRTDGRNRIHAALSAAGENR